MKPIYYKTIGSISTGVLFSFVGLKTYENYQNTAPKENFQKPVHIEYMEKNPNFISDRSQQILRFGIPKRSPDVSSYSNHCLCYNQSLRTPMWVAEHLNRNNQKGSAARQNSNFRSDPNMGHFSAFNSDYQKSGWSRGHMTPAANNKCDQKSMDDSFYLSNIVPQDFENNGGFWNRLEIFCKNLVERYDDVYVYSGPLYLPYTDEDTKKKYVKYEVIGGNNVAVPTHLFKIVVAVKNNAVDLGAFIVPNKKITYENKLTDFQVEVAEIEKAAGVTMLPKLDYKSASNLCKDDGCKLISKHDFDLWIFNRRLNNAKNMEEIESLLQKMQKGGIQPDYYTENVINTKKEQFKSKESQK